MAGKGLALLKGIVSPGLLLVTVTVKCQNAVVPACRLRSTPDDADHFVGPTLGDDAWLRVLILNLGIMSPR